MHDDAKRITLALSALTLLMGVTAAGCASKAPAGPPAVAEADMVARGKTLVGIGGCHHCHTPMKLDPEIGMPVPDMTRMLSGHPEGAPEPASTLGGPDQAVIGATFTSFRLPFGIVYTANLTPEMDTGLGGWTEDMFFRAMRTGRHMGGSGRPILPPMPWENLAQLTDPDLKAIFAYLRTIPAIRNDVPAPKVPDEVMVGIAASYDKLLAKHGAHAATSSAAGPSLAQR